VDENFLAARFAENRDHLRSVAVRMLGSLPEAEDAVQETWLRLARTDVTDVGNLGGWLTTVLSRVCLDMLRSRRSRREQLIGDEPVGERPDQSLAPAGPVPPDPAAQAVLADSLGPALLVVLDTLAPTERLAFVLHDLFAVPYEEVGGILDRTPAAARQLASRARRRVQGAPEPAAHDLAQQWAVVDAFLAAARAGDFDGLLAVLDPDVVARSEAGVTTGAEAVARGASTYARLAPLASPALVNGVPGVVVLADGRPERALAFTVVRGRIAVMEIVTDPARVAGLDIGLQ
jgi:RNA polymerase sigma-70 factor (ECF subfamily)